SADLHIFFGDAEAVGGLSHDAEPALAITTLRLSDQDAETLVLPSSNAAAKLVELGEAKPVGILDNHHARIRHVNTDFDDNRAHQDVEFVLAELVHHNLLVRGLHLAVQ